MKKIYKEYNRIYGQTHKVERNAREKRRNDNLKLEVLSYYAGVHTVGCLPNCKKCGITDIRVLSIDHINNNGGKHRKELREARKGGAKFYYWLKKNNYPQGYQVLCMNCQFIKKYETKSILGI